MNFGKTIFFLVVLACQGCSVNRIPLEERPNYVIGSLINSGDLKMRQGDYTEAEKLYQAAWTKAAAYLSYSHGGRLGFIYSHLTIFDPLDRLGVLYVHTHNYNRAEQIFLESKALRDRHLGSTSIFRAPPRLGLGQLYAQVGENEKSFLHFREAEKIINRATTSYISVDSYRKVILFQQFENYMDKHDLRKANRALDQLSSAISGSVIGNSADFYLDQSRYFEMKGRYYLVKGELDKARYHLERAKKIATAYGVAPALFKTIRTQAILEWKLDNIIEAAALFNDLMDAYRKHVKQNFASMTEFEREMFYQSLKEDFEIFNSFVADNLSNKLHGAWAENLYNHQLFSKALLLNEINKRKSIILSSDDASLKMKLTAWKLAKDELAKSFFTKQPNQHLILSLTEKIEILERDINEATGLFLVLQEEPSWKQIQGQLSDRELAIEIIRIRRFDIHRSLHFTDSVYYVFMFINPRDDHPNLLLIKNGNELESHALPFYRNSLLSRQPDTLSYQAFWKPLSQIINDAKKIYLSSDGVYNQISLNTLQSPDASYVSEEAEIIFLSNTKDLLNKHEAGPIHTASLFGRPNYLIDTNLFQEKVESKSITRAMNFELMADVRESEFADLPKTENEILDISAILTNEGWDVSRFLRDQAVEQHVKSLDNPGIVHIATHGFFKEAKGAHALVQSGIILAGVSNTDQYTEDGVLTAYEATNLNLEKTYLVVLSACETGLGEIKNGEGVYGLQRGFKVAGARFILMSLWKVDDLATSELMTDFYKYWLTGTEIHLALKMAQDKVKEKYTHPYYWGGFVLLGN